MTSVDARGYSSNLSQQFEVSFDDRKNSLVIRYVSASGVPITYPNLGLQVLYDQSIYNDQVSADPFPDTVKTSGLKNMIVLFNPDCYEVMNDEGTEVVETVVSLGGTTEEDHSFTSPTYKMSIINVDEQKSIIYDISVLDGRASALPEVETVGDGFSVPDLSGDRFDVL